MTASRRPWRVGEVIVGLYEVLEVAGDDTMGLVHRVHHREWGTDLAVKAPPSGLVVFDGSDERLRDFEAEAETWIDLGVHPHTVSCGYVHRLGGVPRVFAEWVDGGSLADWVSDRQLYEGGPRSALERIVDVAIQFAWGLAHTHAHGVIHQDVKPANVLLTRDGIVKLTDFGCARVRPAGGDSVPAGVSPSASWRRMTQAYCSPEQAAGAHQDGVRLTRATDVWSWAVSVLELFAGRRPCDFGPAGGHALAALIGGGQHDPQIPAMPDDLAALLGACFAPDPMERPETMSEIADALVGVHERAFESPYQRARPEPGRLLAGGLSNRALSMLELGHHEQAHALWDQALDADRHHVHTIYNRGLERWRRGRMTDRQLVAQLETARAAHPDDQTADRLLARVHLERDDCDAALAVLGDEASSPAGDEHVDDVTTLARQRAHTARSLTLTGHDQVVSAVAVSAQGDIAVTGCNDGSMLVWELGRGSILRALRRHRSRVLSLHLSADGHRAVSADRYGIICVWDVRQGTCVHMLQRDPDDGRDLFDGSTRADGVAVALSADGMVVVAAPWRGQKVYVWDLSAELCVRTLDARYDDITQVDVSADGRWAFSGETIGAVRTWNIATATGRLCIGGEKLTTDTLTALAVLADGDRALLGLTNGAIKVLDVGSGRCLQTLKGHAGSIMSIALRGDGQRALTGSNDATARLWDVERGRCLRTIDLRTRTGSVPIVALSADGRVVLTCGPDPRTVQVREQRAPILAPWSYTRPQPSNELKRSAIVVDDEICRAARALDVEEPVAAIAALSKARAVPGYERNRTLLDMWRQTGRRGQRSGLRDGWGLNDLRADPDSIALSADGRLAFTDGGKPVLRGRGGGGLRIYELQTDHLLQTLEGHEGSADSLAMSAEGRLAASEGWERGHIVRVWELESGRCVRRVGLGFAELLRFNPCAVSATGRFVLTSRRSDTCDNAIELWDTETGSMLHSQNHAEWLGGGALSADGRLAVWGGSAGTIHVGDLATGHCLRSFDAHDGWIHALALSADQRFAVSGGNDRAIRVWELSTARCLLTLTGHERAVTALSLSADSHLLISRSDDGTARVWEFDWEYEFPSPADWDERARPHLESFLAAHAMIAGRTPLASADSDRLMLMLERVGFGWLRRHGVVAELERMWADRNA